MASPTLNETLVCVDTPVLSFLFICFLFLLAEVASAWIY